ncbi:MAG TPA: choice-of-anchor tandem repeat NxxGxxAF-containing protein, partial [Chthoniobacteraceae bacterium]|nr:choice-of-anchor tandem repeat NxxGxxAF-containing protein [Chthoniobacteraceae bacterium]
VPFTASLSRLLPETIYYYRAVASNAAATVYGTPKSFSTPAFTTVPVASVGDPAAGVSGGEFASFGNPAINTQNFVAFEALLANGAGGVTATDNSGIWAEDGTGTRDLVARTGQVAPGAGSGIFQSLSSPVYNDNDAVAFLGELKIGSGTKASAANGIWSNLGRSLALVARQGSPATGIPGATFKTFGQIALPDQGKVVFLATTGNGKAGIWAGSSAASLQLVIAESGTLNGKTIQTLGFLPALPYVAGQSRSFAQATGALVMNASFTDKSTGIIEIAGTTPQLIALSGSAAPGVGGGYFEAFSSPSVNANGNIAMAATLAKGSGGVGATDNTGIWAEDNTSTLRLVARTGSAAPGTSSVFTTLGNPVYNNNDAVAFRGTLKMGKGQASASESSGIWANNSGSLQLVALQGSQAAGCPPGATFRLFNAIALPDEGAVILLATLNNDPRIGVTAATNLGIWTVDVAGNMQLIARKGEVVSGRQITSFSFLPVLKSIGGQGRNFDYATGDLIFQSGYSDKSSGLSAIIFP